MKLCADEASVVTDGDGEGEARLWEAKEGESPQPPLAVVEGEAVTSVVQGGDERGEEFGMSSGSGGEAGVVVRAQLVVELIDSSAPVVSWFEALTATLEKLHLPLECEKGETWGGRLAIPKKGGGMHFSNDEQAVADAAYSRMGTLYEYVAASSQLSSKREQMLRLAQVAPRPRPRARRGTWSPLRLLLPTWTAHATDGSLTAIAPVLAKVTRAPCGRHWQRKRNFRRRNVSSALLRRNLKRSRWRAGSLARLVS